MRICHAPGCDGTAKGAPFNFFNTLDAGNGEWLQGGVNSEINRRPRIRGQPAAGWLMGNFGRLEISLEADGEHAL